MKKIISLIFVLAMIFACSVPVSADWFEDGVIKEGCYDCVYIRSDSKVSINSRVEIKGGKWLGFFGDNIVLTIDKDGFLTGNDASFCFTGSNYRIIIKSGGRLDIAFDGSDHADDFSALLEESGVEYKRDNNRITAGKCEHIHTTTEITTICNDCGEIIKKETHENYNTASTFSKGYPEIVYGVGGIAIGFIVAMLIFRKKKVAVSSMAAEDEE